MLDDKADAASAERSAPVLVCKRSNRAMSRC